MRFDFRDSTFDFTGGDDSFIQELYDCQLFQRWLSSLDASLHLQSVEFQSIIRAPDGRVARLKISTVTTRYGCVIPRILILDGRALALVVIVNGDFVLLTEQPRIATGGFLREIPVANTDGADPSPELASRLLARETGVRVEAAQFVDIVRATAGRDGRGVHPYCGPCDRHVFIYAARLAMSDGEAAELDGREVAPDVRTRLVRTDDVAKSLSDFVGLTAMLFYRKYSQK
jgi:non-ribosomal peptide synthetase component F